MQNSGKGPNPTVDFDRAANILSALPIQFNGLALVRFQKNNIWSTYDENQQTKLIFRRASSSISFTKLRESPLK